MLFKIKWKHMEKNVHSTFQKILMEKNPKKNQDFFYNFVSESSKTCEKKNVRTNSNIYI